jgi:hypothetical protein
MYISPTARDLDLSGGGGGCSSVRDRGAVDLLGTAELLSCQEYERCFSVRNKKDVCLSGIRVVCKRHEDFVVCQEQDGSWSVCQVVYHGQ